MTLDTLPYADAERLVMVWETNPRGQQISISGPDFRDWQRDTRSFQQMAAFTSRSRDLTGPGTPEHLDGSEISSGFFSTLGVELALGREFSVPEDLRGGSPVAIISDCLWRDRFEHSPEAIGKSITLDGVSYSIVGVRPSGFRFEGNADVYTPLGQGDPLILNDRTVSTESYVSRA